MRPEIRRGCLDPTASRRGIISEADDPHGRSRKQPRQHEMLEGLRTLERSGIGHEHSANRPVFLGYGENRSHAVGDQPLERVAGLGHNVVLEQSLQPENA